MAPASDTAIRSATLTGIQRERDRRLPGIDEPARARPCRGRRRRSRCACRSGRRRSSARARAARSCSTLTSSDAIGSSGPAAARGRSVRHSPSRYIAISPARGRGRRARRPRRSARAPSARNCVRRQPARSLTIRLYGRICTWSCGNATASTVVGSRRRRRATSPRCTPLAHLVARARGAGRPMMTVGDVERRKPLERLDQRVAIGAAARATACAARRRRPRSRRAARPA